MRFRSYKLWCCLFLSLILLTGSVTMATETTDDFPTPQNRSQMVRVLLSRLGLTDRMDVTLHSPYILTDANENQYYFQEDSELAFLLTENEMTLHYQGVSFSVGQKIKMERTGPGSKDRSGFVLTNYPALYEGDLLLDVFEGKLRPVLNIHIEDYLLGVVPYEMSDAFPLEALKAQAIAARTYALRRQTRRREYDVLDTTSDQVFRGYIAGNPRAEEAVAETRGVCGFYKGALAECYYSASNGGQMELVETVWTTDTDYSYYTFGPDPYDLENPLSEVRSYTLQKNYTKDAPLALRSLLAEQLREKLQEFGYDTAPESLRVDQILNVSVLEPLSENSKWMTMLRLEVKVSGRVKRSVSITLVDHDNEDVALFATQTPAAEQSASPATFAPVTTLVPTPTPAPIYDPFVEIEEAFIVDIPIFPEAENAFQLSINSNYQNEIWSVRETEKTFIVETRRYGHGVGMSQRGAQWMAATYNMTYRDILGFYYPGMTLMRYVEQPVEYAEASEALMAAAGPAPTPTPRPTLMPVTIPAEDGQWYALVTGIAENSSLNLRATPSLNSEILMRLYKNQRLLVVERCEEEGWVKVKTDAVEGYVKESYLSKEK